MPDFQVEGMSCQHCVQAVTRAVHEVDPAAPVSVDLASGKVAVTSTHPVDAIRSAIDEAGYTAVAVTAG